MSEKGIEAVKGSGFIKAQSSAYFVGSACCVRS